MPPVRPHVYPADAASERGEASIVRAPEHLPAPVRWAVQWVFYDLLEPSDSFTVIFRKAVVAVGLPLGTLIMLNGAWHLATAATWTDWVVGTMQLLFVVYLLCFAVVRHLKVVPAPVIDAMLSLVWIGIATLAVLADNAQLLSLMGAAYLAVPFTQPQFPRAHAAVVALLALVICHNKAAIPQSLTADPDAPLALAIPGTSLPPFRVRAAASFATLLCTAFVAAGINYVAQEFRRQICQARRSVFVAHTIAERLGRYRTADAAAIIQAARGAPTRPFEPPGTAATATREAGLVTGACPHQLQQPAAGGGRLDAIEVFEAAGDGDFRDLVAGADPDLLDALGVIVGNLQQLRPHLPNWLVHEVGASNDTLLKPLSDEGTGADDDVESAGSRGTTILLDDDAAAAAACVVAPSRLRARSYTNLTHSDDTDDDADFGSAGDRRVVRREKPGVVLLPQHRIPLRIRRVNIARVRVRVDHITTSAMSIHHRHGQHSHNQHASRRLSEATERIVAAITAHAQATGAAMHGLIGDCVELSWGAVTVHACPADPAVRFLARVREDPALGKFDLTAASADDDAGDPLEAPGFVTTLPPHAAMHDGDDDNKDKDKDDAHDSGQRSPPPPPLHHHHRQHHHHHQHQQQQQQHAPDRTRAGSSRPPLPAVTAVGMCGPAQVLLAGTRGDVAGITIHAPWTAAFDAVDAVSRRLDAILVDEDTAAAAKTSAAMRAACAVRVPERSQHTSTERAPSPQAGSHLQSTASAAAASSSSIDHPHAPRRASVSAATNPGGTTAASSSAWSASSSGLLSRRLSSSNVTGTPPATARTPPHTAGAEVLMTRHPADASSGAQYYDGERPLRKARPSAVIRCFEVFDETFDFAGADVSPFAAQFSPSNAAADAIVAAMHASVTEALDLCLQRRYATALKNLTSLPPMYETLYFTPALADLRTRAALGVARELRESQRGGGNPATAQQQQLDNGRGGDVEAAHVAQLRTAFDDSAAGGNAVAVIPRCLWW